MKKKLLIGGVVLCLLAAVAAFVWWNGQGPNYEGVEGLYQGTVINKETGKPIRGVPVSDGQNIVVTDKKGRYVLPGWERSRTVSVYTLTNEHDDWYYYTDGQGGTYDFAITPAQERKDFRILHTSDTEIAGRELEFADFYKGYVEQDDPGLLMHTGDISDEEGMNKHREGTNYQTMGVPVRYAIGNHDYAEATNTKYAYGEQMFEKLCGPVWYSFDLGGVHCVVLSHGKPDGGGMASGYEMEDQWTWLKNDLETVGKDKPLVIFNHSTCSDSFEFIVNEDMDLKEYGLLGWIYGHSHTNLHLERNGVNLICTSKPNSGGIDSSPACLRRIDIKDGKLTSEMYYRQFPREEAADEAVWTTKLGGIVRFCEPIMDGNDLLVGTTSEVRPNTCGVYRVDGQTGEVRWFFQLENGATEGMYLDGDRLYAQDITGTFYCLNAENGQVIWEKQIDLDGRSKMGTFVVGDVAFGGSPGYVLAMDKMTGKELWKSRITDGSPTPARTIYDSARDSILVNSQWGLLRSINVKTGHTLWRQSAGAVYYRTSTPCIEGDVIYTGGDSSLVRIDANTGKVLLEKEVGASINVCGGPVIDGDVLYCNTGNRGVLAVDKNTLEVLRTFPVGEAWVLSVPYLGKGNQTVESEPVIQGDTLIFTAADGKVYFYDKNTAELIKTINMSGPALTAPIVKDGYLYTVDFFGTVCKYKV